MEFPKIFRDYEQMLRQRRRMDYDDQMVYALRILRQHPRILKEFQGRYRYFCVDEAQDTSKIQHRIIRVCWRGRAGTSFWWGTRIRASTASGPPTPPS